MGMPEGHLQYCVLINYTKQPSLHQQFSREKTRKQLVAKVRFWWTGENRDEHYGETLKSTWKLCTGIILKNSSICYKTFTLKGYKILDPSETFSHTVCVQIRWFAFSYLDSLYKHMEMFFSLFLHIPCVYPPALSNAFISPYTNIFDTLRKQFTHIEEDNLKIAGTAQ